MTPTRVPAALATLAAAVALALGGALPAVGAGPVALPAASAPLALPAAPALPAAADPAPADPAAADPAADPAADAAASTQVTWGVRPADTVHGTERPNFAYTLPPGGTLSDALVVTNKGDAPLALDVYAADGFLTPDGTLDVLEAGRSPPRSARGSRSRPPPSSWSPAPPPRSRSP